jgi:hypothetical protein
MKNGKWMKALKIARLYFIYFFVWFGAITLADYLFFEEVIDNHVIEENLWVSPFMALFSMIKNRAEKEEETESINERFSSTKE